jgi:hypothetical protein
VSQRAKKLDPLRSGRADMIAEAWHHRKSQSLLETEILVNVAVATGVPKRHVGAVTDAVFFIAGL